MRVVCHRVEVRKTETPVEQKRFDDLTGRSAGEVQILPSTPFQCKYSLHNTSL